MMNDPETVAAVTSAFQAYEAALVANDVEALQSFFWKDAGAVRFGVTEELYGYEAIAAFRAGRILNFKYRRPVRSVVNAFGADCATVMYEYVYDFDGRERRGRQSQTWVRFEGVWKIVAAHVSLGAEEAGLASYVDSALGQLGLTPEPAWRSAILGHFAVSAQLAAPLMEFPLPPEVEPAPIFQP